MVLMPEPTSLPCPPGRQQCRALFRRHEQLEASRECSNTGFGTKHQFLDVPSVDDSMLQTFFTKQKLTVLRGSLADAEKEFCVVLFWNCWRQNKLEFTIQ